MSTERHGLSIGIDRVDNDFFLSLKIIGKLTHADYEAIVPMLESALEGVKDPHIKAIVDLTEMDGWELRAAWDDLKLGIKHNREFDKIAIFGNKSWHELSAKVGSWFMHGEAKYFDEYNEAIDWLKLNSLDIA